MGCQGCKSQQLNESKTFNSELRSENKHSIIQEYQDQITFNNMEIKSTPYFQNDTIQIQVPSIEFQLNDEFIVEHTSSNSSNQLRTLKQIVSVMKKGNLNYDINSQKSPSNNKPKRRRLKMKDLEREF